MSDTPKQNTDQDVGQVLQNFLGLAGLGDQVATSMVAKLTPLVDTLVEKLHTKFTPETKLITLKTEIKDVIVEELREPLEAKFDALSEKLETLSDKLDKLESVETYLQGIEEKLPDASEEGTKLAELIGDGLVDFCTKMLEDVDLLQKMTEKDVSGKIQELCINIVSNENVKGALADAVFHGSKRLSADGEAQQAIATVSNLIFGSQTVTNIVNRAITTAGKHNREFFASKEFKDILKAERTQLVASLQETINLAVSEAAQDLKSLKVTMTVGGPDKG